MTPNWRSELWVELGADLAEDWGPPHPLPCAVARPGEQVFIKATCDGFHNTGLAAWLQQAGVLH